MLVFKVLPRSNPVFDSIGSLSRPNAVTFSGAISACPWPPALQLLERKGLRRDAVCLNGFLDRLAPSALRRTRAAAPWRLALHGLQRLGRDGLPADVVAFSCLAAALEPLAQWPTGLALLPCMARHAVEPNQVTHRSLLSSCKPNWRVAMECLHMAPEDVVGQGARRPFRIERHLEMPSKATKIQ